MYNHCIYTLKQHTTHNMDSWYTCIYSSHTQTHTHTHTHTEEGSKMNSYKHGAVVYQSYIYI